jgi:hypothetical protein
VVIAAAVAFGAVRAIVPLASAHLPVDERAEAARYSAHLGRLDAQYRESVRDFRRDQQVAAAQVAATIETASTLEDRSRVVQALQRISGFERFQTHEENLRRLRDQVSALPLPASPAVRQVYSGYLTAYNTAVLAASAMAAFPQLWQDSAIRIAAINAQEAEDVWWRARRDLSNLEKKYHLPDTQPPEPEAVPSPPRSRTNRSPAP